MATVSSHYDIARFGSEVVRFSPKQSDVLMVLGTINDKMAPVSEADLRSDGRTQMGDLDGRVRNVRRILSGVSRDAGHR
jgi:hypothetical protein